MNAVTNTPAPMAAAVAIALASIVPSKTNPRQNYDKAKLQELADSIRAHGVVQPVLVRPLKDAKYELVVGERRFRAAKIAEQPTIPALVRELTDKQALEIQVIENLQREDLHPLEEAEGYEKLMKQGYDVPTLAAKIGKSKEYVYCRMKLTALSPKCRKLFHEGRLSPSIAIVVARIPIHKLQDEAIEYILDDTLTAREAAEFVQREFMLALKTAPFPTGDEKLLKGVGPCGACPKRTGNQPELFGDIKIGADVCTDPVCFAAKRTAHGERLKAEATARGLTVLTGPDAKKVKPHAHGNLAGGFVELDAKNYEDPKHRTWRQILGKSAPVATLLDDPHASTLVEIVKRTDVDEAAKQAGIKLPKPRADASTTRYSNEQKAKERRARLMTEVYTGVLDAISEKLKASPLWNAKNDRAGTILVAQSFYDFAGYERGKLIADRFGWSEQFKKSRDVGKLIAELSNEDLSRFVIELALVSETRVHTYYGGKPEYLLETAKRLRVDVDKIQKAVEFAHRAKQKGKAKAKTAKRAKPKAAKRPPSHPTAAAAAEAVSKRFAKKAAKK